MEKCFCQESEGKFGIAASPADTRFLGLKQHPESHPNRYPGVENSLDVL
jgi:hypothetical protein